MNTDASQRIFDPFSLTRLLKTSFGSGNSERVCVLIDLPNPKDVTDLAPKELSPIEALVSH